MKIFGNTRVQGRIAADTGSFKLFGVSTGDQVPTVVVAGTDSTDKVSISDNRSVIAQGQFDYLVTSQNSGISFDQAKLQAGRVVGFRVQHVTPTVIYTLRTQDANTSTSPQSSINISTDGGISFQSAYTLPNTIVAFDMFWLNEDEAFVVGGKPGVGNSPSTEYKWRKFSEYGLPVSTFNVDPAEQRLTIFKKSANLNEFKEWGTAPLSLGDCATTIAVDSTNPDIVLIGTQRGKIYKSTDGALTWTDVFSINGCVNRIKFVTGNSNEIYVVGTNGSIVKSTSAGSTGTWQEVDLKDSTDGLLVNKTRDGRVPAFNDILVPNTTDVIVVGDDHTKILKSSDSGVTWKFVESGIYADYLPIEMVKSIQLINNKYHLAISANKLFVGSNLDLTQIDDPRRIDWTEYQLPEDPIDLHLVSETGDNPKEIQEIGYAFILTKSGLYEFNLQTRVLSPKYQINILSSGDTPQRMIAHSYRELYIVTANAKIIRATKYFYRFGETFKFAEETSGLSSTDLITVHTANDGRIYAGSSNGTVIYKNTGSIVSNDTYSTDPVTWTSVSSAPTGSNSKIIQLQAVDHGTVFALVQDTDSLETVLFKTIDTGSSWTKLYIYSESVKRFIAYDASNIYTVNRDGNKIYYTNDTFSTVETVDITVDHLNKYYNINYFELDAADTSDISSIKFLFGGPSGVGSNNGTFSKLYNIGPWQDNQWALMCISGESGYSYWIGGGTTFGAQRGSSTGFGTFRDVGSEPILLISTNGGEEWSNAIGRLLEQEPPLVNNSGGDFAFTSISEGKYFNQSATDVFNIYQSVDQLNSFQKQNSNLYREGNKYPGNLNGIRKIRFYDSNFGVAVSDINQFELNDGSKVSITTDGGTTWRFLSNPTLENYNFSSLFITTQSNNNYEIYLAGYPTDESIDGILFKSSDSGKTWITSYSFPKSINGLTYRPRDIFFVNSQTGSVSIFGGIDDSPSAVEGIYTTYDGGSTWNFTTITDFAAGGTRGHLQFITLGKGYAAGSYSAFYKAGLFKTTDSGVSWSRIVTPYDNTTNKPVSALHFLTEAVGIIGIDNQILRTTDSGSNWTVVHNLKYSGSINEIKFSANGQLGIAVGYYNSNNNSIGDHFVLKSTNSGSSWLEVDSNHDSIDLEFELDVNRNSIGQSATLYTVAFAEKIVLTEEKQDTPDKKDPDTPKPTIDCIGSQFMSASYYNFENFAYKCTPSGSFPKYYPNSSNNIGLGKGIFGQQTSVDLVKLRNTLTYGAALGVGALGKAQYSRGDTATGFGAMDTIKSAKNNVAIGFKALSKNILDEKPNDNAKIPSPTKQISQVFGLTSGGRLAKSNDGGNLWAYVASAPSTSSYTPTDPSSSINFTEIYKITQNDILALATNPTASGAEKTIITKYNNKSENYNVIYSSSIYTIDQLEVLTPSLIYGIDKSAEIFLRSSTGGKSFTTGSILNASGNTITSFKMGTQNFGFIVGSKIWKLQSGSSTTWETSSYSGSNIINGIDSLDSKTWFAVGASGSIYKSTNGGLNWNSVTHNITTKTLNSIKIDGSTIITAGNSGSLLVSTNRGISWKQGNWRESMVISSSAFPEYNFQKVEFLDPNSILILYTEGTSNGIIKSEDKGKTWFDVQNSLDFGTIGTGEYISSVIGTYFSNNLDQPAGTNINFADSTKYTPSKPGQSQPESPVENQKQPSEIVDENVAVGAYSLNEFENSSRMVAIGANALKNITTVIGNRAPNAGTAVFSDGITKTEVFDLLNVYTQLPETQSIETPWEQKKITPLPSTYGQIAIGAYSQNKSIDSSFNTSIGYASMYQPDNSSCNTAVGFYSHHLANNNRNTSVGVWSLGLNGDIRSYFSSSISGSIRGGDDNVAIGYGALLYNIKSTRAAQILSSLPTSSKSNANVYRIFRSIGSRNIAIGNFALQNANGSTDTIAIGHNAVSDRGSDLTDSVFIGNYVGEYFRPKIGTYYSSSTNNDWKFTQTVAVGSRTLQNQIGHDIVAVGANALRGTLIGSNAANPNTTITTEPYHVFILGLADGSIIARQNISRDFFVGPNIPTPNLLNIDDKYSSNLYGTRGVKYNIWENFPNGKYNPRLALSGHPTSVAIADRNTAYGIIFGNTGKEQYSKPILVKTSDLSLAYNKFGDSALTTANQLEWNIVNTNPNGEASPFIEEIGIKRSIGPLDRVNATKINVPDPNTIYILARDYGGSATNRANATASGSAGGADILSRDILVKATSDAEFDLIVGAEFKQIKSTIFVKPNKRTFGAYPFTNIGNGTDGGIQSVKMTAMHFPATNIGMVVGTQISHLVSAESASLNSSLAPYAQVTFDGGTTFSDISPFNDYISGSGVTLNSIWVNNTGTFACAVGDYGSIYTWTSDGSTGSMGPWVRRLGGSATMKVEGDIWDNIYYKINVAPYSSSISNFFDTLYPYYKKSLSTQAGIIFQHVKFYNDSVGYASGYTTEKFSIDGKTSGFQLLFAKTTDGGVTWTHKEIPLAESACNVKRNTYSETIPQPWGELLVIDETRIVIGFTYGQTLYTQDGGDTWTYTGKPADSTGKVEKESDGFNPSVGLGYACNPYQIVICADYKEFEGQALNASGSVGDIIMNAVTIGSDAQVKQKAVIDNVAIGYKAQFSGSGSAINNVQIGANATLNANEIINTVGIGKETLKATEYSNGITAVGAETFLTLSGDKSNPAFPITMINPLVDTGSLGSTSGYNTAVGYQSGYSLRMGDTNVYVGYNSGIFQNQNIPTYGNNNIAIGANGPLLYRNKSNGIHIGNGLHDIAVLWGQHDQAQPWVVASDRRDKTETGSFATGSSALTFLRELDVKQFKWDSRYMYPSASGSPDGSKKRVSSSFGYIAQELESAAIAAGFDSNMFVLDTSGSYSDGTGSFDLKLIKPGMVDLMVHRAVKELDQQIQTSKYTASLGDGTGSVYSVTHSLNSPDIIAMVYSTATTRVVYPTMSILSNNTMTVSFDTIAAPNEYRLIVMK